MAIYQQLCSAISYSGIRSKKEARSLRASRVVKPNTAVFGLLNRVAT